MKPSLNRLRERQALEDADRARRAEEASTWCVVETLSCSRVYVSEARSYGLR